MLDNALAPTRIVVFGTGECGHRVLAALRSGVEAVAVSDNNPRWWGQHVSGALVVPPAEVAGLTCDYVVVCSTWAPATIAERLAA